MPKKHLPRLREGRGRRRGGKRVKEDISITDLQLKRAVGQGKITAQEAKWIKEARRYRKAGVSWDDIADYLKGGVSVVRDANALRKHIHAKVQEITGE